MSKSTTPSKLTLKPNSAGSPFSGTRLKTGGLSGPVRPIGTSPSRLTAVTSLIPTWLPIAVHCAGFASKVAFGHCGTACGSTFRPSGRSTRTFLTLPSGVPSTFVLKLKSVRPSSG